MTAGEILFEQYANDLRRLYWKEFIQQRSSVNPAVAAAAAIERLTAKVEPAKTKTRAKHPSGQT